MFVILLKPASSRGLRGKGIKIFSFMIYKVGIPTSMIRMNTEIVKEFDAKLDAKKRVTLRDAKSEFYHVTQYNNGSVFLEPRVLIDPEVLKDIENGVMLYKKGDKGIKVDLSEFPKA